MFQANQTGFIATIVILGTPLAWVCSGENINVSFFKPNNSFIIIFFGETPSLFLGHKENEEKGSRHSGAYS